MMVASELAGRRGNGIVSGLGWVRVCVRRGRGYLKSGAWIFGTRRGFGLRDWISRVFDECVGVCSAGWNSSVLLFRDI